VERLTPGDRRDHVTLLVVSGPIGSGKTSVTEAVAAACRERGHTAAVIDLDVVYEMLDHRYPWADPAVWQRARRLIGGMAEACFAAGVDVVALEGAFFTGADRADLRQHLTSGVEPRFVTLRVGLDEALRRVQRDPNRRLSRNPEVLARAHREFDAVPVPHSDLVLDTDTAVLVDLTASVLSWLGI
jgi:adenylylsulfate kinase-like enzyme